jgi:hypothetical protein
MPTHFCQKDHTEDLDINGKIILEWILWKYSGKMWIGCIWPRIGTSGVFV